MVMLMDAPTNGTRFGSINHLASTSGPGAVPAILSVTSILTAAMIMVVATRTFIRTRGGIRSARLVDWMHVLACLFSIAVSVAIIIGVHYGVGRHRSDASGSNTVNALKFYWVSKILYIIATWVVKMTTFSTLLITTSAPPQQGRKSLKTMLYGIMIFMTSYSAIFWIGTIIECSPMSIIFDKKQVRDERCLPPNVVIGIAKAHAAMNTGADMLFFLLPIFMVVYGVRRSAREKIALSVVFMLAFFSVCAAGVHTLYEFGYGKTSEVLYDESNLAIWAIVEINVGLIAISLPALSPLFHRFLQPQLSPARSSSLHSQAPATPTPSTLVMSSVCQQKLERSESERSILNPYLSYSSRPAPPFVTQSTQRFSSDSKSGLNGIIEVQVDIDIEQHPAFKVGEETAQRAAAARMGHRRMPTPVMF